MKVLLDQNLPTRLMPLLAVHGCEAVHVKHIDLSAADDGAVWSAAQKMGAVVLTKDRDFVALAAEQGRVIWLRVGNCSNQRLAEIITKGWPGVLAQLEAGERRVELRA